MLNRFLKDVCSPLQLEECVNALVIKCDDQGRCSNKLFEESVEIYFDRDMLQRIGAKWIAAYKRNAHPERRSKAREWMRDGCQVSPSELDDFYRCGVKYLAKHVQQQPQFKKVYGGYHELGKSSDASTKELQQLPESNELHEHVENILPDSPLHREKHQAESWPCAEKRCTKCGGMKPRNQFNNRQASPDGKATECKHCSRLRGRRYLERKRFERVSTRVEIFQEASDE